MMKLIKSILFPFLIFIFIGCNLFVQPPPKINLSYHSENINSGDTISVNMECSNFNKRIFGISLRIQYDPEYLILLENQDELISEIWADGTLSFIENNNNVIHLSLTQVDNTQEFKPAGIVSTIRFITNKSGLTAIDFINQQLCFYDLEGNEIDILDIETNGTTISII